MVSENCAAAAGVIVTALVPSLIPAAPSGATALSDAVMVADPASSSYYQKFADEVPF